MAASAPGRVRRAAGHFAIPHSAVALGALLAIATPATGQTIPPLPDSSGWPVQVLAIERAPDSSLWIGTFAIGDVPPGEYLLGVEIEGERVYRDIRVDAGRVTWVEFTPAVGR